LTIGFICRARRRPLKRGAPHRWMNKTNLVITIDRRTYHLEMQSTEDT